MVVALRELDLKRPDDRWDRFVFEHPLGTFFHLHGFARVVRDGLGCLPHYFYAEDEDRITGILPLFVAGKRPFARALVSVPLGVGGGILANDDASKVMLREAARALGERLGVAYIEYKSDKRVFSDLTTKDDVYFGFSQPLFGDRERQLGVIPRKTRAVIREAERARLRATYNRDDLGPFLDLYALSLRNLGTPMFPREVFETCLDVFPQHVNFLSVRESGRTIGVVMNFYFRDAMMPFFVGTAPDAREVGVNNYLYWVMLETGYDLGYRRLDMGRSKKDTGSYRFKEHMGMTATPLEYQYDLLTAREIPNVSPLNPRYARAIDTWKRLPIGVTRHLGPYLSRRIP